MEKTTGCPFGFTKEDFGVLMSKYVGFLEGLSALSDENERKLLLENCMQTLHIRTILLSLLELSDDDLYSISSLSGAGMIKVKLFENKHFSVRYHIFHPNQNIFHDKDTHPHIHDFQGVSKVLMGTIQEEMYSLVFSDKHPHDKLKDEMEYWLFDSVKQKKHGSLIEKIYPVNQVRLQYLGERKITQGNSYFLPAHQAHVIKSSNEITATLCLLDTTYASMNYQKQDNAPLRGYVVQSGDSQKKQKNRSFNQDIGLKIMKEISTLILQS